MLDLSVCIVSHESRSHLGGCLESVYAHAGRLAMEVIVVDNCSTDGSARFVEQHFPQARLHLNERRRGFAANANQAFRLSHGRYMLALNPDTVILKNALETMVDFMDSTPQASAAGCRTVYPDGQLQYTCRAFPSLATVLWRWLRLERLYQPAFYRRFLMADWPHDDSRRVDWVMGSCLLLRRQAAFEVELFDEGFYLYYEDIDLCHRLHQAGQPVYYIHSAQIIHEYQRHSARGLLNRSTLWHIHSIWRYFRKHGLRLI